MPEELTPENSEILVHGVDVKGRYIGRKPMSEVYRAVFNPPPPFGTWVLNLSYPTEEHWTEAHCVDKNGFYVGNVNDAYDITPTSPPQILYEENWKWDFQTNKWIDFRTDSEILVSYKKITIANAWNVCMMKLDEATIDITTSAGTYSYGMDFATQDNVMKMLLGVLSNTTPNPRNFTPKGKLNPISVTHDDIKTIAQSVGSKYDAFMSSYILHKKNISLKETVQEVIDYDLTLAWPPNT